MIIFDHNGLNNQRKNLRKVTDSLNARNRFKIKNSLSQYKGVTIGPDPKHFRSRITVDGTPIYLGYFSNEILAAKAYNKAAIKYHGEFAHLNVI